MSKDTKIENENLNIINQSIQSIQETYYPDAVNVFNSIQENKDDQIQTHRDCQNNSSQFQANKILSQSKILQKIQEQDEDNYEEILLHNQIFNTQFQLPVKRELSQTIESDRSVKSKLSQVLKKNNSFQSLSDSLNQNNGENQEYYSTGISSARNYSNLNSSLNLNSARTLSNVNNNSLNFDTINYDSIKHESQINFKLKFSHCIENLKINKNQNRKNFPITSDQQSKYEINIDQIDNDNRTTLMIKNIPNQYNSQELRDKIDINFLDKYDFFYLPWDLQQNQNHGYAFINMIKKHDIIQFYNQFHSKGWEHFKSKKICNIFYARIQGKLELQKNFQDTKVLNMHSIEQKPIFLFKNSQQNNNDKICNKKMIKITKKQ